MLKHCKVSWNHTYLIPFGKDIFFLKKIPYGAKGTPLPEGPFPRVFFYSGSGTPLGNPVCGFFHKPLLPSMLELVEDSLDLR